MLSDADVAALYDVLNPWDPRASAADAFFHELVMSAGAVLDVGCGTGSMLRYARGAGHPGRLTGIDPDTAALARARSRTDIEWVEGVAADIIWSEEFDLAAMASHAFQCLITDEEIRASLSAIRRSLKPEGRFAFDTRHPQAEAWAGWSSMDSVVTAPSGEELRVSYAIESVEDGVVTLSEIYRDTEGHQLRVDPGKLRFLDVGALNDHLARAGFEIDEQFGDFERGPVTERSDEIVTIARRT